MRRIRFLPTLVPIFAFLCLMVGLVAYSPTLYRWFCGATGYGGAVRRALAPVAQAKDGVAENHAITVFFDSNVASGLPWDFHPERRMVTVKLGEPTLVYYYAKNKSDRPIVARAVYNVAPADIATFFFKIQCFCFTSEKLAPGESARMPVVFYIDEQAALDDTARTETAVTLSYTFYAQNELASQEVAKARDLRIGSAEKEVALAGSRSASFANDVPRQ